VRWQAHRGDTLGSGNGALSGEAYSARLRRAFWLRGSQVHSVSVLAPAFT